MTIDSHEVWAGDFDDAARVEHGIETGELLQVQVLLTVACRDADDMVDALETALDDFVNDELAWSMPATPEEMEDKDQALDPRIDAVLEVKLV